MNYYSFMDEIIFAKVVNNYEKVKKKIIFVHTSRPIFFTGAADTMALF